jgi:hypothetical protein
LPGTEVLPAVGGQMFAANDEPEAEPGPVFEPPSNPPVDADAAPDEADNSTVPSGTRP